MILQSFSVFSMNTFLGNFVNATNLKTIVYLFFLRQMLATIVFWTPRLQISQVKF